MSKPKIPNQRKANLAHKQRVEKYAQLIQKVYDTIAKEAARLANLSDPDESVPFSFADYPLTKNAIVSLQAQLASDVRAIIMTGTSEEWKESNLLQDLVANKVITAYTGTRRNGGEYERYFQTNPDALKAFQERKDEGMNLSTRVWKLSEEYKTELEESITAAIAPGTSAMELAAQVKQYLKFPDKRFRRIKEKMEDGTIKWHLSKNAKAFHPGQGVYRSSSRNAQRLARTEINMAYRTSEQKRWEQFDFVVGYEVKTTQNGKHVADICDQLAGKYPKDFKFTGWHPQCYDELSEVLTRQGWKRFKDVVDSDEILSLNPESRELEWVGIVDRQCYDHTGDMIHFFNRSLDCLVTPEHRMVYLNKSNGEIRYCQGADYTQGKGAFYRGAEYYGEERGYFEIEGRSFAFDDFCEFMGYYLSDGSLQHGTGVCISQQEGETAFDSILDVCRRMGYDPKVCHPNICVYNSALNRYLRQFGRCTDKFIPEEIKTASKRQIRIFLDAFLKCDGSVRLPKSFIGSHGNVFHSDRSENIFFTTSEQMAGDLSELILKVGHRPSFSIQQPKIARKKDGSIIKGNHVCYRISECYSTTATVFKKEVEQYSGKVYDLTLERNHIMYIRRNGKCFWGSNCMCYCIPILKTEDEFWAYDPEHPQKSANEITELPPNFREWIDGNRERIEAAEKRGKLPYFIRDNREDVEEILNPKPKKTPLEIAAERHSARTQEDVERIRENWSYRKVNQFWDAINDGYLPKDCVSKIQELKDDIAFGDFDEFNRMAKVLDTSIKRHKNRNSSEANDIQARWDAKRKQDEQTKMVASNVLKVAQQWSEVDYSVLEQLIADNNLTAMRAEAKAVANAVKAMKAEENALADIIPEVHTWHDTFSLSELKATKDAVLNTLSKLDQSDLSKYKSSLEYEADWVLNKTSHKTKNIAYAAYQKQIKDVEEKIWWNDNTSNANVLLSKISPINKKIASKWQGEVDWAIKNSNKNYLNTCIAKLDKWDKIINLESSISSSGSVDTTLLRKYIKEGKLTKAWGEYQNLSKISLPENTTLQPGHYGRMSVSDALDKIKAETKCSDSKAQDYYDAVNGFSFQWDYEIRQVQCGNGANLVSRHGHTLAEIEKRARNLEEFIQNSPKWDGGKTYRGMSLSPLELDNLRDELRKGIFNNLGSASWSSTQSVSDSFAGMHLFETSPKFKDMKSLRVVLILEKQKWATSIQHISSFPGEDEVLASMKCRYGYVKEEKIGNTLYITVKAM